MKKNVFLIIYLSTFLLAGCGKNTNSTIAADRTALYENYNPVDGCKRPSFLGVSEEWQIWNDWYALDIALLAFLVSFIACCGTVLGAWWQKKAEINTRSLKQIQREQQEFILLDFIRHIYRNKVIISALQWKLDKKYNTHYPSDEHILKLRIPLEELQLDKFYDESQEKKISKFQELLYKLKISNKKKLEEKDTFKNFDEIHKLKLLCRNVNIEVGITYEHLKMRKNQFLAKDKKLDLDVLEYKCQLLTQKIIELMYNLDLLKEEKWNKEIEKIRNSDDFKLFESVENKGKKESDKIKNEYLQKIRILLYSKIQDNKGESVEFKDYYDAEKNYREEEGKYREEGKEYLRRGEKIYYSDILQISAQLNYDVYMEGKMKTKENGVIKLIKFQSSLR